VGALELVPKQYVDAGITTVTTSLNDRVLRAGDTMTGGLVVPVLYIQNAGYSDLYFTEAGGAARWLIRGNDPTTSNLEFHRYNAGGGYLGAALTLDNVTADAWFTGVIHAPPGLQFGGSAPTGFYGDGSNVAIRTYGNNVIYFQNATGTLTYATMDPGGLLVNGAITATAQDGLRVTVPAGYYARTYYTVSGVRSWTAGVYADGRYAIGDENVPAARLIIDLNGKVWFANDVELPGTLTANTINAVTANISGTGNFGAVNTGSLNVSGNGDIAGNLVVHGTLTATGGSGGGTPGVIGNGSTLVEARGYRTKNGTDGPFIGWGGTGTPAYFNVGLQPPAGTAWGLYVDNTFLGTIPLTTASVRINGAAPWETVKKLVPAEDMIDDDHAPLLSDKVITALTKALQEAITRIEALELKVEELSHARSG
jgi:hypothetical protein